VALEQSSEQIAHVVGILGRCVMRDYYAGDPYWLILKYPGTCAACGAKLKKGDRAFRFKNGKLYGDEKACCGAGTAESEQFEEAARAEWAMNHGW
jgi:hypothetical protein